MNYYGLADCNNFYASCERAFNPRLKDRPVAILSNNDGCIVARSKELKALDIPMAIPYWKCKEILSRHNTAILSSNYRLYGDMSDRVMDILEQAFAEIEVYSIDEAFIRANGFERKQLMEHGLRTRAWILRSTGIPVSIGFGPTKTLAKLANKMAKANNYSGSGVYVIEPNDKIMDELPVNKVWGISKGLQHRLNQMGIHTIREFTKANEQAIRKRLGVLGQRMLLELNGIPCNDLIEPRTSRKHILVSRTFKSDLKGKDVLMEAVSKHAARAGEKLRNYNQVALGLSVFIRTNPFKDNVRQLKLSGVCSLPVASSDTSLLIRAAKDVLDSIYDHSASYKKLGIGLFDLRPRNPIQTHLFESTSHIPRRNDLMDTMDEINSKFGKGTLRMASYDEDIHKLYRKERQSPEYTTDWNELLEVK